jgi:hypothetical protein
MLTSPQRRVLLEIEAKTKPKAQLTDSSRRFGEIPLYEIKGIDYDPSSKYFKKLVTAIAPGPKDTSKAHAFFTKNMAKHKVKIRNIKFIGMGTHSDCGIKKVEDIEETFN